jgi:hypothetical protein
VRYSDGAPRQERKHLQINQQLKLLVQGMDGLGKNLVQVFATCRDLHWEFLRLWTGFELPSSWHTLPAYGTHRNRNSFCVMRWPQIDLGAQDLNDI